MIRKLKLTDGPANTSVIVCPHITLNGLARTTKELWQSDQWELVCNECGDVFEIEYEVTD